MSALPVPVQELVQRVQAPVQAQALPVQAQVLAQVQPAHRLRNQQRVLTSLIVQAKLKSLLGSFS